MSSAGRRQRRGWHRLPGMHCVTLAPLHACDALTLPGPRHGNCMTEAFAPGKGESGFLAREGGGRKRAGAATAGGALLRAVGPEQTVVQQRTSGNECVSNAWRD